MTGDHMKEACEPGEGGVSKGGGRVQKAASQAERDNRRRVHVEKAFVFMSPVAQKEKLREKNISDNILLILPSTASSLLTNGPSTSQINRLIHKTSEKSENCALNFLFCPTKSPKNKGIQFTMI